MFEWAEKGVAQISRQRWFKKTGQSELYIKRYQNLLDSGTDCYWKDGKICLRNTVSPKTSECLDDQQECCTLRVILKHETKILAWAGKWGKYCKRPLHIHLTHKADLYSSHVPNTFFRHWYWLLKFQGNAANEKF